MGANNAKQVYQQWWARARLDVFILVFANESDTNPYRHFYLFLFFYVFMYYDEEIVKIGTH